MARRHRHAWWLLVLALVAGCATPRPRPTPAPPVEPGTQEPGTGAQGTGLDTLEVYVHDLRTPAIGIQGATVVCGGETRTTNPDGTAHFDAKVGRQLDCEVTREGYDRNSGSAVPGSERRLSIWLHRAFAPTTLEPLSVEPNARWFRTASGRRFDWREISAFPLLGMVQAGRADLAREFLRESRQTYRLTLARVFLTYTLSDYPAGPDRPRFRESLDELLDIAAQEGMYLRLTYIAATEPWGGVWYPDRRDIWTGAVRAGGEAFVMDVTAQICGRPHVIGELANEPIQIGLRHSVDALKALGRRVKAACPSLLLNGGAVDGSDDQDTAFAVAPFDFVDGHIERRMAVGGFEWVKRSGEYALIDQEHVGKRMPFVSGEPANFGEWRRDGRNDDVERSPSVAFAYGAVSRARQYNATFHYDGGLYGTLPQAETAEALRCFTAALDAFPMTTDTKWRGHWAESYFRQVWPGTDDTREVETHVRRGRGPWRVFGAGPYAVAFPEPPGWDWRANLTAPADRIAECTSGSFPAAIYRRQ